MQPTCHEPSIAAALATLGANQDFELSSLTVGREMTPFASESVDPVMPTEALAVGGPQRALLSRHGTPDEMHIESQYPGGA